LKAVVDLLYSFCTFHNTLCAHYYNFSFTSSISVIISTDVVHAWLGWLATSLINVNFALNITGYKWSVYFHTSLTLV